MNSDVPEFVRQLRGIVASLECGDQALAEQQFDQLMREREGGLFSSLGRITRELHQAVQDIRIDGQLNQFAKADMPDACSRLDYVMQVTEKAAHRTLDLVESSRALTERAGKAMQELDDLRAVSDHGALALTAAWAVSEINDCNALLRANLSALAQAQEYQDLSGQVIRRVITLVRSVENALISLLQAAGQGAVAPAARTAPALAGPAVAGLDHANNQQDADALLAELGF